MAAILERAQSAASPTASVSADTAAAAAESARQWQTLRSAGVDLAVIPNVPNVVYTPTLFQSFGQSRRARFRRASGAGCTDMGSAATAAFNQAFQAASAALAQTEQQSLADFNQRPRHRAGQHRRRNLQQPAWPSVERRRHQRSGV